MSIWRLSHYCLFCFFYISSHAYLDDLSLIISLEKSTKHCDANKTYAETQQLDFSHNGKLSILNAEGIADLAKQISKFKHLKFINFTGCCLFHLSTESVMVLGQGLSNLTNFDELNFSHNFNTPKESPKLELLVSSLLTKHKLNFNKIVLTGNKGLEKVSLKLKSAGFRNSGLDVWEKL